MDRDDLSILRYGLNESKEPHEVSGGKENSMKVKINPGEAIEDRKKATVRKMITKEDVTVLCNAVDLAPSSLDPGQIQPLLQTFVAGVAWIAVTRLVGPDSTRLSSHLDFGAPIQMEDTITAVAQVDETTEQEAVNIQLVCRNQRGKLVLKARINAHPTRPA